MRDYVRSLQERCKQAAQGQLSEEEQEALAQEAMHGFGQVPVMGRSVWDAANNKNWHGLIGALGAKSILRKERARKPGSGYRRSVERLSAHRGTAIGYAYRTHSTTGTGEV